MPLLVGVKLLGDLQAETLDPFQRLAQLLGLRRTVQGLGLYFLVQLLCGVRRVSDHGRIVSRIERASASSSGSGCTLFMAAADPGVGYASAKLLL